MSRYSIMVREGHKGATDRELCQCDSNPEAIVAAAQRKTRMVYSGGTRKVREPLYEHVYFVDRQAKQGSTSDD